MNEIEKNTYVAGFRVRVTAESPEEAQAEVDAFAAAIEGNDKLEIEPVDPEAL